MKLFTEEEKQYIWTRSRFKGERVEDLEARGSFFASLDAFTQIFQSDDGAWSSRLFDLEEDSNAINRSFLPMFRAVVRACDGAPGSEHFRSQAFSGWQTSFLNNLRAQFQPALLPVMEELAGAMPSAGVAFQAWAEKMRTLCEDGSFFHACALSYPVFARQMLDFISGQAEHLRALLRDTSEFVGKPEARAFGIFGEQVVSVSPPGSDRHQGGRTVHILTFENGVKLVYKPHSTAIDRAFGSWINFFSEKAGLGRFPFPRSVDLPGASFNEYVSSESLPDETAAGDFFRRAGLLFGAVYLLCGSDMHYENILAHGIYPIAVDMETVLSPEGSVLTRAKQDETVYRVTMLSFLPTMAMLPGFRRSTIDSLTSTAPGLHNLPYTADGKQFRGSDFPEQICEGFSAAVRIGLEFPDELEQLLRDLFVGCRVRMVLRATALYGRVSLALASRDCLRDGGTYELLLSRLRPLSKRLSPEENSQVLEEEKRAIRILDTPYFSELLTWRSLSSLPRWIRSRGTCLESELSLLRVCLETRRVADDTDIPWPSVVEKAFKTDSLQGLYLHVACTLEDDLVCFYACREDGEYRAGDSLRSTLCLLDGGLGSIVALAAYERLYADRADSGLLSGLIQDIYRADAAGPALTAAEPGLADGAGGFLLGTILLFEMGFVGEAELSFGLRGIEKMTEHALKLKYTPSDVLYGAGGLCAAIQRLPDSFMTEKLRCVYRILEENVLAAHRSEDHFSIRSFAARELTGHAGNDPSPVCNHTLRFGNAGKLYNITLQADVPLPREKDREALMALLADARNVLPMRPLPPACVQAGLFSGLPGVLYSLCRALAPEKIPALLL